jgi:ABC-type glutathione transport system ATPase component
VRNADQIVVLDHGHVVEAGDHASLMARHGRYASLAGAASLGDSGDLAGAANLPEAADLPGAANPAEAADLAEVAA